MMHYGGNQGREPDDDRSPEPSVLRQLITGLAIMFVAMIAAHCAGVIS